MVRSGGTYIIINKKSGTAFDLSGSDQKSIIGFNRHGGDNQKWLVVQHQDRGNGWTIQNVYNHKYLDIESGPGEGVKVVATQNNPPKVWDISGSAEDGWRITVQGNDHWNVDLSDYGNPAPGTHVELWGKWDAQNQLWWFEQVS